MNPLFDLRNRQVVPRWRTSRVTASLGELATVAPPRRDRTDADVIAQKVAEWREHRTASFAADVLASAIVDGAVPEAREAAEFILLPSSSASEAARIVARRVLNPETFEALPVAVLDDRAMREVVATARRRTRADLRNALAWADLSLAYASLGFVEKALRAMEVAAVLAPANRFILRARARLLVHADDLDTAIELLRKAPNVRTDPWVLAAEIAVSEIGERRSRFIKHASTTLARQTTDPFQITELASAIGTVELFDGNRRMAKKLFQTALEQPTDNTVAQAAWVARESGILTLQPGHLATPRSFEARAREFFRGGEWEESLSAALCWMEDEPFSPAPALFASYVAAVVLERFDEALGILDAARIANPDDWTVLNNTAFCYASIDRPDLAQTYFEQMDRAEGEASRHGTWLATSGLIAFRGGEPDKGRTLYEAAINELDAPENRAAKAMAAYFASREELVAESGEFEKAMKRARDIAKTAPSPELPFLLERLAERAKTPNGLA